MRARLALVLGFSVGIIGSASSQAMTVAPGPEYGAGWLHRFFLGNHYRKLWTTPVEAELLDLGTFAGGLRPTKRGGGQQTSSLRFKSADGRQFAVRSVDKDPSSILPAELRGTVVDRLVQDQISAGHPAAPLVVAPLLDAAGVLHSDPRLVVLPVGDPRLGEFEADFGGMLGILEERPEGGDDDEAGFAGAAEIINTDKMEKLVNRGPSNTIDARAFLAARLVDVYLGDWDRHRDQWRWARFGDEKPVKWVPIPRDRDQAFVRFDGLLLVVARGTAPQLVNFGPGYSCMLGLTWNGRDLDRRHLVGLELAVWDSIALDLQARMTDEAIESAVAHLPAPYIPLDSARLAGALKERRDHLPEAARRYYRHLAGEVDLHGTAVPEIVNVKRSRAGTPTSPIAAAGAPGAPWFRRRFDRRETNEVRLYVQPDDSLAIEGLGRSAIPCGRPRRTGRQALCSSRHRDSRLGQPLAVALLALVGPRLGFFFGGGATYTRYGFRKDPFAHRYRLRAGYATGASTIRAEFTGMWHLTNSPVRFDLLARGSGIEVVRFHGFGNETSATGSSEFYRVNQVDYLLAPGITFPLARHFELTAGPQLARTRGPTSSRTASSPSRAPTGPVTSARRR